MTKRDDDIEDRLTDLEIHQGVNDGISRRMRTICITSTTACFSSLLWIGSVIYDKFPAFKAGIIAFLQADKGIK